MAEDAADLLNQALKLPPEVRAALADSLIDSLDTEADENAEEAWRGEIALRVRELDSGAVQTALGDAQAAVQDSGAAALEEWSVFAPAPGIILFPCRIAHCC